MKSTDRRPLAWLALGIAGVVFAAPGAFAYDGQKCKEPGVCWEPKPGYPAKIAGSKYDPKHNPVELAKQLKVLGADVIDASSGGNVSAAKIPIGAGYQTPFAERLVFAKIREALGGRIRFLVSGSAPLSVAIEAASKPSR